MLEVSELCAGEGVLEQLEKDARERKKGFWAEPQPVLPREWRKRKGVIYWRQPASLSAVGYPLLEWVSVFSAMRKGV